MRRLTEGLGTVDANQNPYIRHLFLCAFIRQDMNKDEKNHVACGVSAADKGKASDDPEFAFRRFKECIKLLYGSKPDMMTCVFPKTPLHWSPRGSSGLFGDFCQFLDNYKKEEGEEWLQQAIRSALLHLFADGYQNRSGINRSSSKDAARLKNCMRTLDQDHLCNPDVHLRLRDLGFTRQTQLTRHYSNPDLNPASPSS